jgi:cell division protein FtsB
MRICEEHDYCIVVYEDDPGYCPVCNIIDDLEMENDDLRDELEDLDQKVEDLKEHADKLKKGK